MSRIAWFNCQAGVAGDMTMAALIDAGADRDAVADAIGGLDVDGYALLFERVQRCGVGATWANVVVHHDGHDIRDHDSHGDDSHGDDSDDHDAHHSHDHVPHRPVREILDLLDRARIPDRIRGRARAVFVRLAEVEGAIHGHDPMDVELHEVGSLDSIVDVVGSCAALESLGIDDVRCSPIAVGHGTVRSAHGLIPNPAPATMALLVEANVPTVGLDTTLEVTTPTGAALMTTLSSGFGAMPPMATAAIGYGAGTADTAERANVVQVVIGEHDVDHVTGGTPVQLLESNVDDVTAEVLAHTVARAMDTGAHDAWVTPIVMKKGRPAHTISVLCDPADADELRALLVDETGTLGVRATRLHRWPQQRASRSVVVDGCTIAVKVSRSRVKVEFDDAAAAARELGLPVRVVIERAVAAATATAD